MSDSGPGDGSKQIFQRSNLYKVSRAILFMWSRICSVSNVGYGNNF